MVLLGIHQRSRGREHLARFDPCLEPREDHRPAPEELRVRALAQLVMGDCEATRITYRLDLPCHARRALAHHIVAPERTSGLNQPAWRINLDVLPFDEKIGRASCR